MGDFSSPKRRDVFDRMRRRIELYRRHHNGCSAAFDNSINNIHEQQRRETIIHRQRWLESKAKKASKQSKSNKDSSSHGSEHRNLIVTQRLKRKIDSNQLDNQNLENLEDLESSAKTTTSGTSTGFNVSVRIEHTQQENNTNVNVNVHTTVETSGDAPANVEATTSVECKKEPKDEKCKDNHNESDILHPDELEALLESIQNNKDPDSIDDHLLDELNKFDQIYQSKFLDDSDSNDCKMYPGVTSVSPGLQKPGPSGYESTSPFDGNQNYNPVRSPPIQTGFRPGSAIAETGPAAETLKQMAAQHQHQHASTFQYGTQQMTDSSHYGQNGFPQGFDQGAHQNYASQNQFMNSSQNMNNMRGHVPYNQTKSETGLNYNGTKPLTHYQPTAVAQQTPPSSLQQLQNQVQSHFNRPQMEITQTQHLQVSDGANRMQMSQTQQLQMRQPPQQISMTQQQSFSMPGANMGPNTHNSQYVNEQLKMQMMRRERAVQARNLLEEHQMQQQYMNRPPPEYKMQQPAAEGYQGNTMGPNPLQTMQDMVNQTNSMQQTQYGQIKTEAPTAQMQNTMMQSHQMSSLQRMNSTGGHVSDVSQVSQPYQVPPMQRQQSYPGAQMSVNQNRPQRQAEPTYTSAIMRNQRPPNVNVGPDGLNISQPRNQHEWQRQMMVSQGQRQGVPQAMARPQMAATAGMMQYQYNNQNGMTSSGGMQSMHIRQTRPMQMNAMQSQAAMMQNNAQAQQMMMQQNLQMSQRVGQVRTSVPSGMNGAHIDSSSQMPGSSNPPDDIMNLLDSAAQGSNPELLDSITVQNADGNNEAAWLDEIFGGK